MSKIESSLSKRLTAHARQVAARVRLKRASGRFPSYLHVFDIFVSHFTCGSRWEIAPCRVPFRKVTPTGRAYMAFV